ncbi:histidine-rich glycoprotein-like [Etheostoma cragini]|uniref:histidine-rich glycoprotein-like n=1 Tax=Etheostoma cragini TaxID=417921 RepID=UPI00155E9275|nr:histidine-rich glycoprotein-like [Etheostoma cragini]
MGEKMSTRGGRGGFLPMFLFLCLIWTQLLITESSSGDHELRLFPSHRHPEHNLNPQNDVENLPESRDPLHHQDHHPHPHPHHHPHHRQRHHAARSARLMPGALLGSRFRQEPGGQRTLDLLAQAHHEVRPEHAVVSARHLVTVVSTLLPNRV